MENSLEAVRQQLIESQGGLVTTSEQANSRLSLLFSELVDFQFKAGESVAVKWAQNRKLMVASTSPAKVELVRASSGNLPVETPPSGMLEDEELFKEVLQQIETSSQKWAFRMAARKLTPLEDLIKTGVPALAFDSVVVVGEEKLEKPVDEVEAFTMVKKVAGKSVNVYSGLALAYPDLAGDLQVFRGGSAVEFSLLAMTDSQIEQFLEQQGKRSLQVAGAIDYSRLGKQLINRDEMISIDPYPGGFMPSLIQSRPGLRGFTHTSAYLSPHALPAVDPYFQGVPTHLVSALLEKISAS